MLVVKSAQVGQAEQEFGEEGAVVRTAPRDEGTEGFYQVLLKLLHCPGVHDTGTIC